MVYVVDIQRGQDPERYVAVDVADIAELLRGHRPDLEFLRVERVRQLPQEAELCPTS